METSSLRRYISTNYVDPAIIKLIDKGKPLPQQELIDCYEYDEDTTTVPSSMTSSPIITQRSSPPQPTASTSLDHLWSKQEKYENLELRLLTLEDSEKRFEHRLQLLEKEKSNNDAYLLTLLQQKPMKPDQQSQTNSELDSSELQEDKDENKNYLELYNELLKKYDALQTEFSNKEKQYKKQIQELLEQQQQSKTIPITPLPTPQKKSYIEQEPCYKEEDGYLLFDTTNMNGEIIHCKVKIPTPPNKQTKKPNMQSTFITATATATAATQNNFITTRFTNHKNTTTTRFTRMSPTNSSRHNLNSKKSLNPNAPEWKKKERLNAFYNSKW